MSADLTVKDLLDEVACSDPAPGGDDTAVLDGALASSLFTMVVRLAVGKKGYEVSEEVVQHARTTILRLLDEFMAFTDKDSAAYNEVFTRFELPKTTDEEKVTRSAAIQKATKQTALAPLEVACKVLDMMSVIVDVARLDSRNAVTDVCVAMMPARIAVLGALLNIRINLGSLKDRDLILQLQIETNATEQTVRQRERDLLDAINQDLRV